MTTTLQDPLVLYLFSHLSLDQLRELFLLRGVEDVVIKPRVEEIFYLLDVLVELLCIYGQSWHMICSQHILYLGFFGKVLVLALCL